MNYIFNVLWFEDNAGWYRLQKPTLESTVSEYCLQCNITPKRSSAFDIEELKATNYDLILMDYDLASKITGAHVISAIRDANILTDILYFQNDFQAFSPSFYSKCHCKKNLSDHSFLRYRLTGQTVLPDRTYP